MLGYETHRGVEMGELPPFPLQGLPGNYPSYPITPQSMGMGPPPPWAMLMNGSQGSVPPPGMIPGGCYNSNGIDTASLPVSADHKGNTGNMTTKPDTIRNITPVSPPPTRERFSYTRYQLELLSGIYGKIRYPNSMQKQLVAKRVGITREQVKIWFQNRRRKDIVGKKAASGLELNPDGKRMVPETVMASVLNELLEYENDPKGKKAVKAQKSFEKKVAKKRSRDDSESTDTELASKRYKSCQESGDDVPIYYSNEPSPVSFDSFSSSSVASPYSNSSQHESSDAGSIMKTCSRTTTPDNIDPSGGGVVPAHSLMTANVADSSNNTVEIMFHNPPPYSVSGEQLDKPSPPNRIAPGVCLNPNLPQRPPSIESPALDPSVENSITTTKTTDDSLQINKDKVTQDRIILKTRLAEKPLSPKEVPPNRIAPPSEPIKFNPKIVAVHHIVPPSVNIPVTTKDQASPPGRPGNLSNISPGSNSSSSSNSSLVTTSAVPMPLQSFTPLYAPDAEHFSWHKMGLPMTNSPEKHHHHPQQHNHQNSFADLNMFFPPPHPYGGPPLPPQSIYPDIGGNGGFDKIMPYMMSSFPGGFPSPYDPGPFATTKHLNNNIKEMENNNISGILKDAYPPAFMMPPYKQHHPTYTEPHSSGSSDKVTYL